MTQLRPGDVRLWLDQGPAVILQRTEIEDPIRVEDMHNAGCVSYDTGWTIKLMTTGEIIDVHENTLHLNTQDV